MNYKKIIITTKQRLLLFLNKSGPKTFECLTHFIKGVSADLEPPAPFGAKTEGISSTP